MLQVFTRLFVAGIVGYGADALAFDYDFPFETEVEADLHCLTDDEDWHGGISIKMPMVDRGRVVPARVWMTTKSPNTPPFNIEPTGLEPKVTSFSWDRPQERLTYSFEAKWSLGSDFEELVIRGNNPPGDLKRLTISINTDEPDDFVDITMSCQRDYSN